MKIIITGSSGFVGQNLIRYFERQGVTIIPLNLRVEFPHSIPSANALIHLAGKAHDLKNTIHSEEYFNINYAKTKELFDLFLASDINDFIFFSSVKAVADSVNGILREDVIPRPKTPYGQSKLKAEQYLSSKRLSGGKRLFVLRPCMIHGPGNKGNLNLLYNIIKKDIPYPLGAFKNYRSFLSISNLLFIIERILKDTFVPGGVYHLADDDPLSTNEVIEIINEVTNKKTRIWAISPSLIKTLARVGDILPLPLNSERLKKLTESYMVSNEKIKKVFRVREMPVSSHDGLVATIKSFTDYSL